MARNASGVSPLVAAVVEQWPFLLRSADSRSAASTAIWVADLLGKLKQAGEDARGLHRACKYMLEASEEKEIGSPLKKAFKFKDGETGNYNTGDDDNQGYPEEGKTQAVSGKEPMHVDLVEMFGPLPTESESRHELHRWEKEELIVAVEEQHISRLILCLCSRYEEVRRQAFMNLSRFMMRVKVS